MMHRDMLLLAERLVIALETMSQDVKNMSVSVYDISCSVSYLLTEKTEKESISISVCDEGDNPPSVTSAAEQEASAEKEYSGQYEQADERSSSHIADPEQEESSLRCIAPMSIDTHGNSDVLSSETNTSFTGGIKVEELSDVEEYESHDVHNVYGDSRNNVSNLKEIKSETQSLTEEEDRAYGLNTTISHSIGQLTPSESTARVEFSSNPVPREIQCMETLSNSTINSMSKEIKSETQLETERENQAYGLHTTVSHSMGPLTPSDLLESIELASAHVRREMQRVVTSSNSADSSDCLAFVARRREGQTSVARTPQMESPKDSSVMHATVDSEERPYKCSFCGKSFSSRGYLQSHSRLHTGERPFKCDVCGRAFPVSCYLSRHMRSHTGERPYSCNFCGKTFTQKSNLTHHKLFHTGEKPYRCNICGRAFRQNGHLTVHMRSHTGENPYKCNICGKAFRHSPKLNQHLRTHSREHPR